MHPNRYSSARVVRFLVAAAVLLAAFLFPTVNRAAEQILVGITVAPIDPTIADNEMKPFSATLHFDDGSELPSMGQSGAWVAGPPLATPRYYHTATRLMDGSILVAGGYNNAISLASAERWNPSTGLWTAAGTMFQARSMHSATLLPNGKVLVAGGLDLATNGVTRNTEIYDPVSNTWSFGPPLFGPRALHAAVALQSGRVLVTAGVSSWPSCLYKNQTELYDPGSNSWIPAGSLSLARSDATAALLDDGRVLLAGGPESNCPNPNHGLNEAEIFNPATNLWSVLPNLSINRYDNFIAKMPDGRVLLAGGRTINAAFTASADVFNPATNTFSLTAPMAVARGTPSGRGDNGTAAVLPNGQVIVAGGQDNATALSTTELFNPLTSTWSTTGSLLTARSSNTMTLLNNGLVMVVGGQSAGVPLASVELYRQPIVWTSSDPNVASIDQNGMATAHALGTTTITASSGAINGSTTLTVARDMLPPSTIANFAAPNVNGWHNADVTVQLNATDSGGPVAPSGVQSITYSMFGAQSASGTVNGSSALLTVMNEGTTTISYQAVDHNGNVEPISSITIRLDKTAPLLNYPNQLQTTATTAAGAFVNFFVSAFDNGSGLSGSAQVSPLQSGQLFPIGTTKETVTAIDRAGNTATATFDVIVTPGDTVPPMTTANFPPPNANGWNRFNVFVNLNAFDSSTDGPPSGVQSITYSLTGAQTGGGTFFNTSTAGFQIFNEGTTTVTYHATDNRGNVESEHTFVVRLDKTQPTAANLGTIQAPATSPAGAIVNFNLAPADAMSGVDSVVFTQGLPSGSLFPHGNTPQAATITDKAGNTASRSFSVTVNKTLLSIAVLPSTASVLVGDGQPFQALGHFTDGSDQILPGSGSGGGSGGSGGGSGSSGSGFWNVHFTPGLDVAGCGGGGGGGGGVPVFSSQSFSTDANGVITNTQWSPGSPTVNVTGQVTANTQLTLTLTCISDPTISSTSVLPWQTTSFDGSITLGGQTTNAHVTGWSSQPSMPTAAFAAGAATIGNKLYVVGGGVNGAPSGLVQVYDLATRTWLAPAAPMLPREGPGVAALDGYIYAAGGHMPGGQAADTLQRFDPVANQWVTLAPMPGPRAEHQLVAANGKLYAIGGETGNGTQMPVATVDQYDPIANAWIPRAPMSSARMFFAAGTLNNDTTIIVAGGAGSSVEVYDIGTNTWSPASPLQVPAAAGGTIANRFYVATQCGSFVYRPADGAQTEGWALMPNMLQPRREFAVAVSGDVLYAAGGLVGSNPASPVASFHALSTPPPNDLFYQQSGASCPGSGGGGTPSLPTVQWSTSDQSIADINSLGIATGNSPGQATIVATAAGISCAATNSCATLTVAQPTHLTFTLAPGSQPFNAVTVTIVDRATGQPFDTFDVPIGVPQELSPEEADQIRILITAPAGHTVSPTEVEPNLHNGDLLIPLLFSLIDTAPPALNLPGDITVDATGPDGAVVTYPASATDAVDGTVPVLCAPASGATFPIGTTTVSCAATDAAGNLATGGFTVLVQAAAAQVSQLMVAVENFNLQQGISNSLDAKLDHILIALNDAGAGNTASVCNQLGAFINETQAQSGKKLTVEQAGQLIAAAEQIKAVIGCP